MVEHNPWIGKDYGKLGVLGLQQIAVVGYSHWLEKEWPDRDGATVDCIRKVMSDSGEVKTASFFTPVRNYFGYTDHKAFWPQIMFFNFLPNCVGGGAQRFRDGTPDQLKRAEARFLELINCWRPAKVFVFTSKSGRFPRAEELRGIPRFPNFKHGMYSVADYVTPVFFLRHPQGAKKELMRSAVNYALTWPSLKTESR